MTSENWRGIGDYN